MAEPRPQLHAVPDAGPHGSEMNDRQRDEYGVRWLLIVLLAMAMLALVIQTWRSRDLHAQVETLSTELSAARAEIAAHQTHLGEVREQMGAVQGVLAELEAATAGLKAVVDRDPATP